MGGKNNTLMRDMLPDNLKAFSDVWVDEAYKCKDSSELITLAKSIYKLLADDPKLEDTKPEDFDPKSGECYDGPANPIEGSSTEGKELPSLAELLTAMKGHDDAGGVGGMTGTWDDTKYKVYSTAEDKEYHKGVLTEGGCTPINELMQQTNGSRYDDVKAKLRAPILTMKSKLKRALLARQQRDWHYGKESGKLDSKRLVAAFQHSSNVYKQRADRMDEDTAITILVDLSGSMENSDKAEVARNCAIALAECLEGSQLTYNIVGFCNKDEGMDDYNIPGKYHRYERLDTVYFKDFNQPLRTARPQIAGIVDAIGGNNSDYDFIVNSISTLSKRPEKRKVLLVISDGQPACVTDSSDSGYIKLCGEAIKHGNTIGVETVGIGLLDDTVKDIYPNHVVINNVNELSTKVFTKLTKLLIEGGKKHG